MFKRILSMLLAIVLCVGMVPVTAFAQEAETVPETTAPAESIPETSAAAEIPSEAAATEPYAEDPFCITAEGQEDSAILTVAVGGEVQLSAAFQGEAVSGVLWTVLQPTADEPSSVASVDDSGLLTALEEGFCRISGRWQDHASLLEVCIEAPEPAEEPIPETAEAPTEAPVPDPTEAPAGETVPETTEAPTEETVPETTEVPTEETVPEATEDPAGETGEPGSEADFFIDPAVAYPEAPAGSRVCYATEQDGHTVYTEISTEFADRMFDKTPHGPVSFTEEAALGYYLGQEGASAAEDPALASAMMQEALEARFPAANAAASAYPTPTNCRWGTGTDTGKIYFDLSKTLDPDDVRIYINLYKNNTLLHHSYYDYSGSYNQKGTISYNLTAYIIDSGNYYFTVQVVSKDWNASSASGIGTSGVFKYQKKNGLSTPKNKGWITSKDVVYASWATVSNASGYHVSWESEYGSMISSTLHYPAAKQVEYRESSAGKTRFRVRALSENLNKYGHSNLSGWSDYYTFKEAPVPRLADLTDLDYLAFSDVVYTTYTAFENCFAGMTVKEMIGDANWTKNWGDTNIKNHAIFGNIAQWKIAHGVKNNLTGFCAFAFQNDYGEYVISFRGSQKFNDLSDELDWLNDWVINDLPMFVGGTEGTQMQLAFDFVETIRSEYSPKGLSVTGHSLGGALCDIVSACYNIKAVSFNAAPFLANAYYHCPEEMGRFFSCVKNWKFRDHITDGDQLAGERGKNLKNYTEHTRNRTYDVNAHSLASMVQRDAYGTVSMTSVKKTTTLSTAILDWLALSPIANVIYMGTSSNNSLDYVNLMGGVAAYGGNGNDRLLTNLYGDKIVGGRSNDYLSGYSGADDYYYFKGDGYDIISDPSGQDALHLLGFPDSTSIVAERSDKDNVYVYANGEYIMEIAQSRLIGSSFKLIRHHEDGSKETTNITSLFKEKNFGESMRIDCPVQVEIIDDATGEVVYTLYNSADSEGFFHTDYGYFYVYPDGTGNYTKQMDLFEGYSVRILGLEEGTMDISVYDLVDDMAPEEEKLINVPVTDTMIATVEVEEEQTTLHVDNNGDGTVDQILYMVPYEVTQGDQSQWVYGSTQGLSFTVDNAADPLDVVQVDGLPLEEGQFTVSEDGSILTLTAECLQEISTGTHVLYLQYSAGYAQAEFTVIPALVITADRIDLTRGDTLQLTALTMPANAPLPEAVWSIPAEFAALATVSDTGLVTVADTVLQEAVRIPVELKAQDQTASITLTIHPDAEDLFLYRGRENVTGKTITFDINSDPAVLQLTAAGAPADAWQQFNWSSSNETVATVDQEGLVSFQGPGTVKITAAPRDASGISASVTVKTIEVPRELFKDPDSGSQDTPDQVLLAGKSTTLKIYAAGKALKAKDVTWSLAALDEMGNAQDASSFASISSSGKLTAKKVVQKVRIEATGRMVKNPDVFVTYLVDIHPAVTQVDILEEETWANGQTLLFNLADTETKTLTARLYPADAMDADVRWTVSDKKGAYAEYAITGNEVQILNPTGKTGTVTIKAAAQDGSKKSAAVKVSFGTFARNLEIISESDQITGGSSLQLEAQVAPANPTKKGVTWKLKNKSDSAYASITSAGKLTAKDVAGILEITVVASSKDGQATAEKTFTILPAEENALMLQRTDSGAHVARTTQVISWQDDAAALELAAYLGDSLAGDVTWTSAKPKTATVANGLVTFLQPGKVKITAEAAGQKESVTINCISQIDSITVTTKDGKNVDEDGTLHAVSGKKLSLKALVNEDASSKKVTWSIIQGSAFGKLSSSGTLTAAKDLTSARTMIIRATAADGSGFWQDATVLIHPLAQGLEVYSIEDGLRKLRARTESWWVRTNTDYTWDLTSKGEEISLNAEVYPYYTEDDSRNALQETLWKSSNRKVADFVPGEDGNMHLICRQTGSTTISVTANDGSKKKVSFKLKVVRNAQELQLEDQEVTGGKKLDLAKLLKVDPANTTTKSYTWEIVNPEGHAYASISGKGVLKAKKTRFPRRVTVRVTAKDDLAASTECTVLIRP